MKPEDELPSDLLFQRLLRQDRDIEKLESELSDYKIAYEYVYDGLIDVSKQYCELIDHLPEPVMINEAIEEITNPIYRNYLQAFSNLIDIYKANLILAENLAYQWKTISDDVMSEDVKES